MKQRLSFAILALLAVALFFFTSSFSEQYRDGVLLVSILAFVGSIGMTVI